VVVAATALTSSAASIGGAVTTRLSAPAVTTVQQQPAPAPGTGATDGAPQSAPNAPRAEAKPAAPAQPQQAQVDGSAAQVGNGSCGRSSGDPHVKTLCPPP
jgi:hypothetical protein